MSGARCIHVVICCCIALGAGCAAPQRRVPTARTGIPQASSTQPTSIADLELDAIQPAPVLPITRPSTEPTGQPPPMEALLLYARALDELHDGRRLSAIGLLEQAIAIDPESYNLHYTLAKAYRNGAASNPRAIEELGKAAELEPNHLDVQVELGRQHLAAADTTAALRHLRLAQQTTQYKADDPRAVEADLFLAHALQGLGYERAALTQFERLLARINDNGIVHGGAPEVAGQVVGKLYQQVGDLYVHQRQPAKALAAYEQAAQRIDDFDVRSRIVRTQLVLGHDSDARRSAADVVVHFHGSPDSIALLRDVHRALGREAGAVDELARLHAQSPQDRSILFALTDALQADHRDADADRLLADASLKGSAAAAEIARRRAEAFERSGDLRAAARVLVEATARRPDLAADMHDLWRRLLRPENHARLSLADLQALPVDPSAEGAKDYAIWYAAGVWPRYALARSIITDAVKARPIFPPAFRVRLDQIWNDAAVSAPDRAAAADALIRTAEAAGAASIAAELRGRSLLKQGDVPGAASALAEAIKMPAPAPSSSIDPATAPARGAAPVAPDLQLVLAETLLQFDDAPGFERLMWKLVSEHPTFDTGYLALHEYYTQKNALDQARRVTTLWRQTEPNGLVVRLLQARDQLRQSHVDAAEALFTALFDEYGDDPGVLMGMQAVMSRSGRLDQFTERLEGRVARVPNSFHAAARLATLYTQGSRLGDATRILDTTRAVAAAEPDVLYEIARLYTKAGQRDASEQVLEQVLTLDSSNTSACNDLGYFWAEQGKRLDQAEALTRAAVRAEPNNPTVLDSLGWVLYKRGRFDEARNALEQAVGPNERPHRVAPLPPETSPTTFPATKPATAPSSAPAAVATTTTAGPAEPDDSAGDAAEGRAAADPVTLDHLGDVMYRLNDRDAAGWYWERSGVRLTQVTATGEAIGREDLRSLRLQLQQKRRQLKDRQPVNVAPVAESASEPPALLRSTRAGPPSPETVHDRGGE